MSVISGMDEVIAYIKTQDEKIKNLETNEKVREELIVELKEQILCNNTHDSCCMCDPCVENDKLKKENEKLKEENSKLKNGIIDEHARAERCKDKVLDLADISKGLQKDVKKLKEENEDMKKQYKSMVSKCGGQATNKVKLQKKIVEKDEEIKKLKEENRELNFGVFIIQEALEKREKEIVELKKEKEEQNRVLQFQISRYKKMNGKFERRYNMFAKKDTQYAAIVRQEEENEELKEKNMDLKMYWRCFMDFADPRGSLEYPDKEFIDGWTDDEELKETLYEDFNIEEEEEEEEENESEEICKEIVKTIVEGVVGP
tara:strand:+ start:56 stop:1003 length:948 start_codon:yes stop_codon:yes gene_type:complete